MFQLKRFLYESSPLLVQQAVGAVPFSLVAGSAYRNTYRRTQELEFASSEQLQRLQEEQLGRLLTAACRNVPAYRSLRPGVEGRRPLEALRDFPLLDKEALQKRFADYVSADSEFGAWSSTTGGTSGNQLQFILDSQAQNREMAYMHRLWGRVGYTPRCRKATFRGVRLNRRKKGEFWQLNPIYNECQFSPFHLNSETLHAYVDQLFRYRPAFIHGYPSAISVLARQCKQSGISLRPLGIKGVLLGSESVFPDQRAEIEAVTGARVLSWYGHSERIVLGGECEHSTAYHQFPDYGVLEIVDDNGNEVAVGETGEIVGTGLWNNAMPLIRYRTGDRARKLESRCECGRSFPRFDQVEGRWKQEYAVGQSGTLISPAALNMHGSFFDQVVRYQYHQQQQGIVELRMMVTPKFTDLDRSAILRAFEEKVGRELVFDIKIVEDIPLTKRGKLPRLIQRLRSADLPVPNQDVDEILRTPQLPASGSLPEVPGSGRTVLGAAPSPGLPAPRRVPVTVIILTKNEQKNIAECVDAVSQFDEVVVVDSGSTDSTLSILENLYPDVRVLSNQFEDFGQQRNWAIDNAAARNPWILFVDADEFLERPLVEEIRAFVENPSGAVGAYIAGRNYFLGTWIKRCTYFPSYQLRLFKIGEVRFLKEGHGQREETNGRLVYMKNSWRHEGFSQGISHWIARHNTYSTAEVELMVRLKQEEVNWSTLVRGTPIERRREVKKLAARLPARPFFRLFYSYILRLGFLDGYAGWIFCLMRFSHEYNVLAKTVEFELNSKHRTSS